MASPTLSSIRSGIANFFRRCCGRRPSSEPDQNETSSYCPKTEKVTLTSLAISKVIAVGGSAVRGTYYIAKYFFKTKEVPKNYFELILASLILPFETIIYIVTKAFNAARPSKPPDPSEILPTFMHPGRSLGGQEATKNQLRNYRLLNIMICIYLFYSFLFGIQARIGLFKVSTIDTKLNYQEECTAQLSSILAIGFVNLLSILLGLGNLISGLKSTMPWAQHIFRIYIIDDKKNQIGLWTWIESLIGISFFTIASYFGCIKLLKDLENHFLCHGLKNPLTNLFYKIFSGIGALSTFIVPGLFASVAAVHERVIGKSPTHINELLQTVTSWQWAHKFLIGPSIIGSALLSTGLYGFVATAELGETIADRDDLNYHPAMILFGLFGAIISARQMLSVHLYNYNRELEYRAKEIFKRTAVLQQISSEPIIDSKGILKTFRKNDKLSIRTSDTPDSLQQPLLAQKEDDGYGLGFGSPKVSHHGTLFKQIPPMPILNSVNHPKLDRERTNDLKRAF